MDSNPKQRGHEVILETTLQNVLDDVSRFDTLLPVIIKDVHHRCTAFKAGNLSSFLSKWKITTSDKEIIDMITGTTIIDFEYMPVQHRPPALHSFSDTEAQIIGSEIGKLSL